MPFSWLNPKIWAEVAGRDFVSPGESVADSRRISPGALEFPALFSLEVAGRGLATGFDKKICFVML
ncbi:hypothetical protein A2U01_0102978 [Trifolium medium]|uniref:Uncharacterized protein n=1 Tax=Trifolium medium TaxID=97028 RepID=A0A392V073_9FABA|nr:hypothetical protein [Trifolium medium]